MIATLEPEVGEETLEDLLARLGVSSDRVLAHPAPGTATEADVLRLIEGPRKRLCELVEGILIEKPMGARESILASELNYLLARFVRPQNLGFLTSPDGPFRLSSGRIRFPDLAFIAWSSLPDGRIPKSKVLTITPDLAIEILSESNTTAEIDLKIAEYFAAGVRLVWIADPESRSLVAYTTPMKFRRFDADETVPGDPVLPGFELHLADWFGILDQSAPTS